MAAYWLPLVVVMEHSEALHAFMTLLGRANALVLLYMDRAISDPRLSYPEVRDWLLEPAIRQRGEVRMIGSPPPALVDPGREGPRILEKPDLLFLLTMEYECDYGRCVEWAQRLDEDKRVPGYRYFAEIFPSPGRSQKTVQEYCDRFDALYKQKLDERLSAKGVKRFEDLATLPGGLEEAASLWSELRHELLPP